ncbi:MAG: Hsp20 family protein [bacterium]
MATFDISPLFRSSAVGFDRAWNQMNTLMSLDHSGFPAYDILRMDEDEFRISLAVPGFKEEDITVETREGSVWIKGNREVDLNHNRYLYRGVDAQGFQRSFQLPEHVKVRGARLEAGMLHIELYREVPEALRPRRIEIETADAEKTVLETTSQAA